MIDILLTPEIILGCIAMIIVTSLLAGFYPSIFISRFSPLNSLHGTLAKVNSGSSFRKSLMVVQFMISIILISSTLIVFDQMKMMRNKPPGFKKEFMILVFLQSANFNTVFGGVDGNKRSKMNAFEDAITTISGVVISTVSSTPPGFGMVNRNVIPEGFTAEDNMLSANMVVDYDFVETYEMEMVSGRDFSFDFGTDHLNAFVVNEEAVRQFNFGDASTALGKKINMEGIEGTAIGVVKDFNFLNLSQAIRPLIMEISVPQFSTFSIRLDNQNVPETLEAVEAKRNEFFPEETFDYNFMDEALAQSYQAQEQFGKLIGYFAFLAIFISCLGSYGLIMFMASRRKKEVGVRKVLGASVSNLVLLLSKSFLWLVVISLAISVPVTIYAANQWLDGFSYRIDISPFSFVVAAVVTLLLVFLTVGFQAYRSASVNPVNSLRSE